MQEKRITRTVVFTNAVGQTLDPQTGEFSDFTQTFEGAMSLEECNAIVRKKDPFSMVTNVEVCSGTYTMSLSKFVENAELVEL